MTLSYKYLKTPTTIDVSQSFIHSFNPPPPNQTCIVWSNLQTTTCGDSSIGRLIHLIHYHSHSLPNCQSSTSTFDPTPPLKDWQIVTYFIQTAAVTPLRGGPSTGSPAYQTPSDPPTSCDTRRRGHAWSDQQRTRKVCQSCPRRGSPGMACTLKENKLR